MKTCIALIVLLFSCGALIALPTPLPAFCTGGDLSTLLAVEQLGGKFKDENGKPIELLPFLKSKGWNTVRLRLWNNPSKKREFVNDLPYTIQLAKRSKSEGFAWILDFHYSDKWADPGQQSKPAAWEKLSMDELEKAIHDYSRDVMKQLRENDITPSAVQIGNEIANGFLWPDGKTDKAETFANFARLLKAARQGVVDGAKDQVPQIIIHIDCGGDVNKTQWFFDTLAKYKVPFDIMALSAYPTSHGSPEMICANMMSTAKRYKMSIMLVEAGYPWTPKQLSGADVKTEKADIIHYPFSPTGQAQVLHLFVQAMHDVPDNLGKGVIYWEPAWIETNRKVLGSWTTMSLFDFQNKALPGIDELNCGKP